jgi:hypothetical protein
MIGDVMHATPYFETNLIKEKRSQLFVDIAQEGVNQGKTCLICDVYCMFTFCPMISL